MKSYEAFTGLDRITSASSNLTAAGSRDLIKKAYKIQAVHRAIPPMVKFATTQQSVAMGFPAKATSEQFIFDKYEFLQKTLEVV